MRIAIRSAAPILMFVLLLAFPSLLHATAPSISSLSPTSGPVGQSVTINGSNFGSTQGSSTVKFNGTTASPTSWSSTKIVAPVPSGATTGNVVVTVSGSASNGKNFTVTPYILSLSPTSGYIGTSVTITGTTFGSTQGSSTVKFNGTTATPTSWGASTIVAPVPTGATTGNVTVTVSGNASNGVSFTVYVTPSISSLSPTSDAVGASITINGSNFQSTQGTSTVTFNGVAASPTTWGNTQIKAPVPSGATTGNVVVTVAGLASNGKSFTVKPTPTISNVSPSSGAVGMTVTITGTNFGSTQGSSTVTFNSTAATPTSWNAMTIVVPIPTGATTGNLVVSTSGVNVSGGTFTVETISSISVTPANVSLPINSVQQYVATANYGDGTQANISGYTTWTSSNTSTATLSANLLTAVGEGQTTIQAAYGSANGSTTLTVGGPSFVSVGDLVVGRWGHTATLLQNGEVLIVGGEDIGYNILASAELYDPTTGSFTLTGSLTTPRENHTATLLSNGQVLIVGGDNNGNGGQSLSSAELYNPSTGTFVYGGTTNTDHDYHTATLLQNGQVLIAGGIYFGNNGSGDSDDELYDPTSEAFTTTNGSMVTPRFSHTATLLNDGTVLIAGGNSRDTGSILNSAEIFNPSSGTFASTTGNMNSASEYHTATLLSSGQVLIAGGVASGSTYLTRAETYNPTSQTFTTVANMAVPRGGHSGVLLNDGTVLMIAGETTAAYTGTAELYGTSNAPFFGAGALDTPCSGQTATLLNDGTVLVAGGFDTNALSSAELYAPTPPPAVSLLVTPSTVNMAQGAVQQFTAVDNLGHPRTDVSWSVSNSTLAVITSDSSPFLSALATGQVTLTATLGTVSAQAQITISTPGSIATGTPFWSISSAAGFSPLQLAEAMPSGDGPDVYAAQISSDGTQSFLQALTSDGQQIWQKTLPGLNAFSVPDTSGGLLVTEHQTCNQGQTEPMSILDLDPGTGEPDWEITAQGIPNAGSGGSTLYCYPNAPQMAIRAATDGAVAIAASGNTSGLPELMLVDGQTGDVLAEPAIPQSTYEDQNGDMIGGYSPIGPPIVGSDGTIYVEYEVRQIAYPSTVTSAVLYLLQIATNNSTSTVQLSSTTANENLFPERIIPDGSGGVLATWVIDPSAGSIPTNPYQAAHVVSGSIAANYSLPFTPASFVTGPDGLPINPSLVLGESGVAFATDGTSSGDSQNPGMGAKVASFQLASGAVNWAYQVGTQSTLSLLAVLSGNLINISDSQAGLSEFDTNGNQTQLTQSAPGGLPQVSWSGNWHIQTSSGQASLSMPSQTLADSFWAMPNGNSSPNGAAIEQVQTNQTQSTPHQIPPSNAGWPCIEFNPHPLCSNYNFIELLTFYSPSQIFSTYIQTFLGAQPVSGNDEAQIPANTNVTASGQVLTFTMQGILGSPRLVKLGLGQGPFSVQVERFDTTDDAMSVVTLQGHPLAGWRYWRVYLISTNDLVLETGAVDSPGPGLKNFGGYWAFHYSQKKMWREYLQFVLKDLQTRPGGDPNATQGTNKLYNFVNGEWNPSSPTQSDILYQVCQSLVCN